MERAHPDKQMGDYTQCLERGCNQLSALFLFLPKRNNATTQQRNIYSYRMSVKSEL